MGVVVSDWNFTFYTYLSNRGSGQSLSPLEFMVYKWEKVHMILLEKHVKCQTGRCILRHG